MLLLLLLLLLLMLMILLCCCSSCGIFRCHRFRSAVWNPRWSKEDRQRHPCDVFCPSWAETWSYSAHTALCGGRGYVGFATHGCPLSSRVRSVFFYSIKFYSLLLLFFILFYYCSSYFLLLVFFCFFLNFSKLILFYLKQFTIVD